MYADFLDQSSDVGPDDYVLDVRYLDFSISHGDFNGQSGTAITCLMFAYVLVSYVAKYYSHFQCFNQLRCLRVVLGILSCVYVSLLLNLVLFR